ncbi:tripartite motif-containing protein 2-like isoform X1 [Branchiostoma lanceolatum]|uniref:tripartite motif-containing protein 2-like isoform X1 n=1 Tax=Branchiostoma lanceolatum TaxID=7740 RepID=UPI003451AF19
MAEPILSKISGDFLECTICLEPFKDPKALPCLHTFCEGCLNKVVEQQADVEGKFPCPTCRAGTVLPEDGVAGFRNNFYVQSLSDTVQAHKSLVGKYNEEMQCDVCEVEVASLGCVPCLEFLCDECACAHHRAKRTRSHEIIGSADLKEQLVTKTEEKENVLGNNVDEGIQVNKMEEEELHAETTFRFTVENFSKVVERKFSPAVFIHNMPWKLCMQPYYFSFAQQPIKNLAVYLYCVAGSRSSWSCHASAELRLIPVLRGVETIRRRLEHTFCTKYRSCGFMHFMSWRDVCNPQKGYIKDDTIILEAVVKADAPRGEKGIFVEDSDGMHRTNLV